jgi:3-methylcrotonyl-CoA carboxylase alpha subunit
MQQPWLAPVHSGDPWSPWSLHDGWRLNLQPRRTLTYRCGDTLHEVIVAYEADGWRLTLGGESVVARGRILDSGQFAGQLAVELDDRRLVASVIAVTEKQEQKRHVFLNGTNYVVLRDDPLHLVEAGGAHGGGLTAPMPGKVVALLAAAGQQVDKGAPLLVLEAMKMEHTITAPKNGRVKAFRYAAGDQVADGAELVDFEVRRR